MLCAEALLGLAVGVPAAAAGAGRGGRAAHALMCCAVRAPRAQVTGHHRLLEDNVALRRLIEMRNPYIDPINILQVRRASRLLALGCLRLLLVPAAAAAAAQPALRPGSVRARTHLQLSRCALVRLPPAAAAAAVPAHAHARRWRCCAARAPTRAAAGCARRCSSPSTASQQACATPAERRRRGRRCCDGAGAERNAWRCRMLDVWRQLVPHQRTAAASARAGGCRA